MKEPLSRHFNFEIRQWEWYRFFKKEDVITWYVFLQIFQIMTLYWNVWQFDMVLRVTADLSFSWRFQFTFLSVLEKWFFLFLLHCHISVYISQNITGYRYGWSNFSLYLSASFKLFSKSSKCFFLFETDLSVNWRWYAVWSFPFIEINVSVLCAF